MQGYPGTQLLAFDYTFFAAEFDASAGKVHVALTDSAERPCHSVSHTMCRPGDIDVRRAVDGMDHTVRLTGSCGHMTLAFW